MEIISNLLNSVGDAEAAKAFGKLYQLLKKSAPEKKEDDEGSLPM